jgi:proline racemase
VHFRHVFHTVETHTGGNPTRTVVGGMPRIAGRTMLEKMQTVRQHWDAVRRLLMYEPRGMGVMSGVLLTEPVHPEADLGVIYIEVGGYLPMCGHDTIGLITALIETGQLPAEEPLTTVTLDTPAGLVKVEAEVSAGHVEAVSFENVPSFLLWRDLEVPVDGVGRVRLDVAWGGNFYGLVEAASVGVTLDPDHTAQAVEMARRIRAAVNEAVPVAHPDLPGVTGLTHVEFFGPSPTGADARNMVIVPPGGVDRSPCGTGTCAKMAALVARGEWPLRAPFTHESVTGSRFTATALEPVAVGSLQGVRVRIRGSAWLFGDSTFVLEDGDPLADGFLLPE